MTGFMQSPSSDLFMGNNCHNKSMSLAIKLIWICCRLMRDTAIGPHCISINTFNFWQITFLTAIRSVPQIQQEKRGRLLWCQMTCLRCGVKHYQGQMVLNVIQGCSVVKHGNWENMFWLKLLALIKWWIKQ